MGRDNGWWTTERSDALYGWGVVIGAILWAVLELATAAPPTGWRP
jgi:hypothetical protein